MNAYTITAEVVIDRLEEAGATLLSLPTSCHSTPLRTATITEHAGLTESFYKGAKVSPPLPSAARITRMDESLAWISLIPNERYVLRRIVGARALVSPLTERHLYSWRRLGSVLGADHKAVQRWHANGIDMIVAALLANERKYIAA